MFFFNSNISTTMFVSVTSHTVYQSKLLSLYVCFVLEFNMWHRFGWVYSRFFCCSIFSFLCSALKIIVCFFSLGHWILCSRFVLAGSISPLTFPNFWTLHCLSFDLRLFASFWYLLITPLIFFNLSFCTLWSPLWCLLIIPVLVFWLRPWYL